MHIVTYEGSFYVAAYCHFHSLYSFNKFSISKSSVLSNKLRLQEALVPRGARFTKSYVEPVQPDGSNKRKKKETPSMRVNSKRRRGESSHMVPMIDGASAQVRDWSYGNLPKRDATRFAKAVRFSEVLSFTIYIRDLPP